MSQAAICHPDTADELDREERKTRQMRYQRLSMADALSTPVNGI
jgi:hypothetical protein